jgi:hypothetical protein
LPVSLWSSWCKLKLSSKTYNLTLFIRLSSRIWCRSWIQIFTAVSGVNRSEIDLKKSINRLFFSDRPDRIIESRNRFENQKKSIEKWSFNFEIMFTNFNRYLISKICIHFNFENERKRTKTGSEQIFVQFLLTTVTGWVFKPIAKI